MKRASGERSALSQRRKLAGPHVERVVQQMQQGWLKKRLEFDLTRTHRLDKDLADYVMRLALERYARTFASDTLDRLQQGEPQIAIFTEFNNDKMIIEGLAGWVIASAIQLNGGKAPAPPSRPRLYLVVG